MLYKQELGNPVPSRHQSPETDSGLIATEKSETMKPKDRAGGLVHVFPRGLGAYRFRV